MPNELTRQDLSLGGEYRWRSIALRGGYRYDISGNNDGSFSLGAGVILGRWVSDLALTQGGDNLAAAPQIAVRFKPIGASRAAAPPRDALINSRFCFSNAPEYLPVTPALFMPATVLKKGTTRT